MSIFSASSIHKQARQKLWVLVLGLIWLISSCDSTLIDPFENDQKYYTIFGYLDELSQNHSVRIIPVTRFPERIESPTGDGSQIDALVYSTDLSTGEQLRWNHQLRQLDDGMYGHVFTANFIVHPGRTYRLDVVRSDSIITSAETTIPRFAVPQPIPAASPFPYEASMDQGLAREIILPGIASPWDIIVTYVLQGSSFRLPYGRVGERTPDGNWKFMINTTTDGARIRTMLGFGPEDPLPLFSAMLLQVRVLDSNWDPPKGEFDPEVLAQPGVLSNVTNGYGVWGGVGLFHYVWIPLPN